MSDVSDHPPIPPNCQLHMDDGSPYLVGDREEPARPRVAYFEFPDDKSRIYLDGGDDFSRRNLPKWRRVIADHGRCAWLDRVVEVESLHAATAVKDARRIAYTANAETWRKWGQA